MAGSMTGDENMCFAGILRRLLCTGSLPTHPSSDLNPDQSTKPDFIFESSPEKIVNIANNSDGGCSTPPGGIVARLMGLDSMPIENNLGRWESQKKYADSSLLGRSRSMNSLQFIMRFESIRSTRASSFREHPTFSKHDFALCVSTISETTDVEKKTRSLEKNKPRKKGSSLKEKNDQLLRSKGGNNLPLQNRDPKRIEKMPKRKRVQRRNPQEKNPTIYTKHVSMNPKSNNPKKKIGDRPDDRIPSNNKFERFRTVSVVEKPEIKPQKKKAAAPPMMDKTQSLFPNQLHISNIANVLSDVCKLADEEVFNTRWVTDNGFMMMIFSGFGDYCCDEVCTEFENQIIEQLVSQAVDELLVLSKEKLGCKL